MQYILCLVLCIITIAQANRPIPIVSYERISKILLEGDTDNSPSYPTKYEVTSLPGWLESDGKTPAKLPSKMYTGFINAGTPPNGEGTMYFHYWLVESERDPENAPVLFWYNGGTL